MNRLLQAAMLFISMSSTVGAETAAPTEQAATPDPDVVIAKVGDQAITMNLINTMLNSSAVVGLSIPALGTPERDRVRIQLLDKAISANLFYLDALKQGVDKDPAYQADLRAFWDDVAENGELPADLDIEDVQNHLITLRRRGLSTASIARHLAAIKMFLRYHHRSGLLRRDVASLIEMPKKWTRVPETVHYDQIEALINAPDPADEFYHRDKAMLAKNFKKAVTEISVPLYDEILILLYLFKNIGRSV